MKGSILFDSVFRLLIFSTVHVYNHAAKTYSSATHGYLLISIFQILQPTI